MEYCFEVKVLCKYLTNLNHCPQCGFLSLENPDWLDEAYSSSIVLSDTGLVMRNLTISKQIAPLLFHLFGSNGMFVDFAGGTGLLVRLMRDVGFDFYWHDPFCTNIHARGFEYDPGQSPVDAITAFEVLEHTIDPVDFLNETIELTGAGVIMISTELYKSYPPKAEDWWYYSFETGQHISFFNRKTLESIAHRLNYIYKPFNGIHVFYQEKYSNKVNSYFNSKVVKFISKYKLNKSISSLTMSDRKKLLNRV